MKFRIISEVPELKDVNLLNSARSANSTSDEVVQVTVEVVIERLLYPRPLSKVQRVVLQSTWEGASYREMAKANGYDEGFVRNVGSQLWRLISAAVGEKVTKNNLKWVVQRYLMTLNQASDLLH